MVLLAFLVAFPCVQNVPLTLFGLNFQISASPSALSSAAMDDGSINLKPATMETLSMEMAAVHYAR
jgi:hypothetical protein